MDVKTQIKLIQSVEKRSVLYNIALSSYSNNGVRNNAWKEIGLELGLDPDICMKKWRNLRDYYLRKKKPLPSGSGREALKPWPLMEYMRFLDPYSVPRNSVSNFSLKRSEEAVVPNDEVLACEYIFMDSSREENLDFSQSTQQTEIEGTGEAFENEASFSVQNSFTKSATHTIHLTETDEASFSSPRSSAQTAQPPPMRSIYEQDRRKKPAKRSPSQSSEVQEAIKKLLGESESISSHRGRIIALAIDAKKLSTRDEEELFHKLMVTIHDFEGTHSI